MAEADLHLKLDRILAHQEEQGGRLRDLAEAFATIATSLAELQGRADSQRELLLRLMDAVTTEDPEAGQELSDLIRRIEAALSRQNDELHRIGTLLVQLPGQVEAATIDGVMLATGEGVDPRPNGATGGKG